MLHWLQKHLIAPDTADWLDECTHWAINSFGADAFWRQTQLVTPDAEYFPEPVNGPEPMARYVLKRVTELAGVADLPWQLCDLRSFSPDAPPLLGIETSNRFDSSALPVPSSDVTVAEIRLQVPFVIDQITKPQDLTASMSVNCARHLLWQRQQTPPGGMPYFEQASEVLAHVMGFGIMLTNSAYTYRGGCGSCYNPRANRQANLSESESVYMLALFCHLRQEPNSRVFKHLKSHLKGSFKLAQKQIRNRPALFYRDTHRASVQALTGTDRATPQR